MSWIECEMSSIHGRGIYRLMGDEINFFDFFSYNDKK
jgi:hypothetical protein